MKLLEKKHIPSEIENKWYDYWLDKKYFSSQESDNHYTIVIPPHAHEQPLIMFVPFVSVQHS